VVDFWLAAGPERWFAKSDAFDLEIRHRFEALHHAAARGEHNDWADSPSGALALLLSLDQFPRNLFRNSAHAYATDGMALAIARQAIAAGHDLQVALTLQAFMYLPFEHAEDMRAQDDSVALTERLKDRGGEASTYEWAAKHRAIIIRFGRFPHRNVVLGRVTTREEQEFLDAGGFSG